MNSKKAASQHKEMLRVLEGLFGDIGVHLYHLISKNTPEHHRYEEALKIIMKARRVYEE